MSFAAFTSAMIVRQDAATDWQRFQLPHVLYFNTLILLVSSATLELTRQRIAGIPEALRSGAVGAKVLLANGTYWVGSSRVDLQACKLEYSIVSPK